MPNSNGANGVDPITTSLHARNKHKQWLGKNGARNSLPKLFRDYMVNVEKVELIGIVAIASSLSRACLNRD